MAASSATAAFPVSMNVATRTRSQREPSPPAQRQAAGPVAGLAVRAHDAVLRGVRAGDAAVHPAGAGVFRDSRVRQVRIRVLHDQRLEPGQERIRRACPHLRDAGHVADRAADRRAREFRHCAVPDRNVPGGAQAAAGDGGGAARRHSVDHLRHVGALRVRARFSATTSSPRSPRLSATSGSWDRCSRARRTASACCLPESSSPS